MSADSLCSPAASILIACCAGLVHGSFRVAMIRDFAQLSIAKRPRWDCHYARRTNPRDETLSFIQPQNSFLKINLHLK